MNNSTHIEGRTGRTWLCLAGDSVSQTKLRAHVAAMEESLCVGKECSSYAHLYPVCMRMSTASKMGLDYDGDTVLSSPSFSVSVSSVA